MIAQLMPKSGREIRLKALISLIKTTSKSSKLTMLPTTVLLTNLRLLMVSKKKENYPPRVNLKSKSSNKLKNSKLNS